MADPQRALRRLLQTRNQTQALLTRQYIVSEQTLTRAYNALLQDINAEIARFDAALPESPGLEDRMTQQALENLRKGIRADLDRLQADITRQTTLLQTQGASAGYQAGLVNLRAGGVAAQFNQPLLETIQSAVSYVDSAAWRQAVGGLGEWHAEKAANIVLKAVAAGKNPRGYARLLRDYFGQSRNPLHDALRLAQTTQNYAARRGTQLTYRENGVLWWIWSANIGDSRTCMSCIVMHGTVHPIDEELNDHHHGRCGMAPLTPAWSALGFTSGTDRDAGLTGIDWFNRLDTETQRQYLGRDYFQAWKAGLIRLEDLSTTYQNDIFGEMRRRTTLQDALNAAA